ncbi:MAG TPA: glycosyltransferase family 4 protein, partial [Polyangiaceae bacterium]|nr:glycosyltransferase family 4 protein [Polyangiaceae bacterium]
NPVHDLQFVVWLRREFARLAPDIVLAFHAKPVIYGSFAGWLGGVPRRAALIEGLGQGFSPGPGWRRQLVRFVLPKLYRAGLRFADTVFFLNGDDIAEFERRGLVRASQRVLQLPGIGVDLAYYASRELPPGPPVFLMVARLLVDKGVREYAQAASRIRVRHPGVTFRLLGPVDSGPAGVPLDEVRSWKDIEYLGETDDVRPHLEACSVFVLPTFYREGLPRSILEAMATGRAIVTTDAPGARETVEPGRNGYLVAQRDVDALTAAIEQCVEQSSRMAEMGRRSREIAEERYRVEAVNQLFLDELLPRS